jgi:hypothetical protein
MPITPEEAYHRARVLEEERRAEEELRRRAEEEAERRRQEVAEQARKRDEESRPHYRYRRD